MKKSSVIGLVIIAIALCYILVNFTKETSTYATFKEAKKEEGELTVVGALNKQRQLIYDPHKNANYFAFYAVDKKGEECKVIMNGTKPQDFERSEQITMTGKMVGNEFHASRILMKCPSKYNKDQVEVRGNEMPTPAKI